MDYNKDFLYLDDCVYLLKEFLQEIYFVKNVQNYKYNLEVVCFDKNLKKIGIFFIKDNFYDYVFVKDSCFYFFNFYKKKYYIYEI